MRETRAAAVFAAVFLFIAVDLALFVALGTLARAAGFVFFQWIALLSVVCATAFSIRVMEGGRWNLGLVVSAPLASGELLRGMLFAAVLIVAADAMVLLSTPTRHARGGVFPWFELGMIFLPAALHEELAFRGYLYQKLRSWNRIAAIVITAALFAALHLGNRAISPIAVTNILLAGVLLALGYERRCTLWFPMGLHFVWNVLSGPILGYGVSGYQPQTTLLRTISAGPAWLSGARFGIEGSIWMGLAEAGGICWLALQLRRSTLAAPE